MFKPLSLYIGLRYTRAKKRNHFISFISIISIIGIMLGVAVLITVLSVMNGFNQQIRQQMLVMVPQVTVAEWGGKTTNWQSLMAQLQKMPKIQGVAPFITGQAMLMANGGRAFGVIKGISPQQESAVSPIATKMVAGRLSALQPGKFNIVLGQVLAQNLGVHVGDQVTLVIPQTNLTPLGTVPRLRQFTVAGIFKVGYQYDSAYALVDLHDAQTLWQLGPAVTGLQLKLHNLFLAPLVVDQLNQTLPHQYHSYDWIQQNPNFFKALQMEKNILFLVLMLIIAIAAFNMLSSLVMLVTDKQADIAILRTLGMQTRSIMSIFVVQGLITGIAGIIVGVLLGVILSLHVTEIANFLQSLLGVQFVRADVYFINFLPSQLQWPDVWHVSVIALLLSFLATLYPAWQAGRVIPAEALRYE